MSEKDTTPVTEASHPITENIDVASPEEMVKQIHLCEQEVLKGWQQSQGMYNENILKVIESIAEIVADIFKNPEDSLIVLSGCGTSGRLGFITVRTFSKLLKEEINTTYDVFQYLMAGGDIALFTSQEGSEDIAQIGVHDLKEATAGKKRVLLIGITCGLSAPYVAGQIDYALDHQDVYTPVLLGFNPVELARNLPIENWDKTFLQVAQRLEDAQRNQKGYILNPLIGPEPITGSTRMKGGSATKIILDTTFMAAIRKVKGQNVDLSSVFKSYEQIQNETYSFQEEIAYLITTGGECLNRGGHVYYMSDDHLGMFGLLDASECPPTYGAAFDDVRGYLFGGYSDLRNKEGDMSTKVPLSIQSFLRYHCSSLTANDIIIFMCTEKTGLLPREFYDTEAVVVLMNFGDSEEVPKTQRCRKKYHIKLPWDKISQLIGNDLMLGMKRHLVEISCKWILNAISTGVHIQKGKVYQNYMVDLNVSNNKLYHRAVEMIVKFTKSSKSDAEVALLKSVYENDTLTEEIKTAPTRDHIKEATTKKKVVPIALMIAATGRKLAEAQKMIQECSVVRIAITKCFQGNESFL